MAKVLLTQEEQGELEYLTGNFDWESIFQAGTLVEELSSSEALVLSPSLSLPHMETWTLLSMALLSGDLQ
ncbi:Forkhead box protein J1 [Microtus ochrogaster]|uniref:Forkhead box protein J1 n=1 Tax=Microtus ochrogaster TaxID=79684 RepID=A0A8J6KY63_MICOH|nr:Forkhead box protein J1 [Microtus ochrogaster]